VLTDDGPLQHQISHPKSKTSKHYWVQLEGTIDNEALKDLKKGIMLNDGPTKPARAQIINEPEIWPRTPPVRYRAAIPTSWISLEISEGRNRQVRRMTAAVGFPTLRLIRYAIGPWNIDGIAPGQWVETEIPPEMYNRK
jgi:23S rRNA pseudouridine2457 synthase